LLEKRFCDLKNTDTTTLSPDDISRAIDLSWCDYFVLIKDFAEVEYYDGPDMLRFFTGLPHPFMNSIFRARLRGEKADEVIEANLERARRRHLPVMWWVGPLTQPADMGSRLEAHGFKLDEVEIGMALGLENLDESLANLPGLSIRRVQNEGDLEDFLTVFRSGFEMEEYMVPFFRRVFLKLGFERYSVLRHYLARSVGKPVSCSSLFLQPGVAGIYNVSTLPEARRKGFGRAVTQFPLLECRAAGYRLAVLQASAMGAGVYRSLGFRDFCRLDEYVWSDIQKE
jgi:GNAT superfamily N-acetyltransferase